MAVAAIYTAGSILGFALALWFLVRRIVRPRVLVDWRMWWPLMRAAAPIGLAGVFGAVLARADTAMLAAYDSATVVGNYGAAYRLYETTFFLAWGVGAAVYPVLARTAVEAPQRTGSVFERSLKLLVALTLPLAVGAIILGPGVIRALYGQEFELGASGGTGKWTRVTVRVGKDEVTKWEDGRQISKVTPGVGPGPVRIKPAAGLELMNLFVREVKEK